MACSETKTKTRTACSTREWTSALLRRKTLGDIDVAEDPEAYQAAIQQQAMEGIDAFRTALLETHETFEKLYEVQPREDAPAGHEYELAKSDGGVDDFDRSARPRQRHPLFDGATGGQTLDGTDSKANLRPPVRTRAGTTTEEEQ